VARAVRFSGRAPSHERRPAQAIDTSSPETRTTPRTWATDVQSDTRLDEMTYEHTRRVLRDGLLALISVMALLAAVAASASAQAVFVNEIHYDNVGLDQDEGIELAGPAGTDLSAYSIELYSGYDGARYSTVSLSGTVPDQENGYGVRFFARPGLQNGAPDGIAVIGPRGVEQALGYEGTFAAVDGGAAGLALIDIGRFEAPSTPVGRSLQLQGTGSTATDFAIRGPLEATPGQINVNQHFRGPLPGGDRLPPPETELPKGCVATHYSGFFIRAAGVRINSSVAFFHATTLRSGDLGLRTIASRNAIDSISYQVDGRVFSHERHATLNTATLSRSGSHTLTITIAGNDQTRTVRRRFRFRKYTTLCRARRVIGTIEPARATVQGANVTVRAIVPPTIKGGAKLRFVVTATDARRLRRARFFLNGNELRGQHAMNAGITATQLDSDGWQTLTVRITPRHGRPVTLPLRFKTRLTTIEPMSGATVRLQTR
jgi:hypothetical protein